MTPPFPRRKMTAALMSRAILTMLATVSRGMSIVLHSPRIRSVAMYVAFIVSPWLVVSDCYEYTHHIGEGKGRTRVFLKVFHIRGNDATIALTMRGTKASPCVACGGLVLSCDLICWAFWTKCPANYVT